MLRKLFTLMLFMSVLAPFSAYARDLVVIVPGGKGAPQPDGFLMRNIDQFRNAGFQVAVASSAPQAFQALRKGRQNGQKVYLVGMSIGAIKAAAVLGKGARPNAVVLFSANYQKVKSLIGSPGRLPPMLLVHHRKDACPGTNPNRVEPFRKWAGRSVSVTWIMSSGTNQGPACGAFGAHGFFTKDQQPIAGALAFLRHN